MAPSILLETNNTLDTKKIQTRLQNDLRKILYLTETFNEPFQNPGLGSTTNS